MIIRVPPLAHTRVTQWLRLSQREEAWKTAEILILRHQLAVQQRRQPRRPNLNWAPRMNAITERWIGGCRRELLGRALIWNRANLRRICANTRPTTISTGHTDPARSRAAETATERSASPSTASENRLASAV